MCPGQLSPIPPMLERAHRRLHAELPTCAMVGRDMSVLLGPAYLGGTDPLLYTVSLLPDAAYSCPSDISGRDKWLQLWPALPQ